MDMREIEAFLAVAEDLHFRRAADRLGVTPSRISQAIQKLERQVGAPLFIRTSRRVRLTSIGEDLLAAWRPAVAQLAAGLRTAQSRAVGGSRLLRVTFATTAPDHVWRGLTSGFLAKHDIDCVRYWQPSNDLLSWLRRDHTGVFLAWFPCDPDELELPRIRHGRAVFHGHRGLLMAQSHPLAGRASVDIEELAEHTVVAPASPDGLSARFVEAWTPRKTPAGSPIPRTTLPFGSLETYLERLKAGALIHISWVGVIDTLHLPQLVCVPLTGLPPLQLVPIWSAVNETPAILLFAEFAADFGLRSGWLDPPPSDNAG